MNLISIILAVVASSSGSSVVSLFPVVVHLLSPSLIYSLFIHLLSLSIPLLSIFLSSVSLPPFLLSLFSSPNSPLPFFLSLFSSLLLPLLSSGQTLGGYSPPLGPRLLPPTRIGWGTVQVRVITCIKEGFPKFLMRTQKHCGISSTATCVWNILVAAAQRVFRYHRI